VKRSLVLSEVVTENPEKTERPVMRLLREYAWPYRWSYLAGAIFLWITNYLAVSIPGQIGHAIDALRAEQPMARYIVAIALMGVAVIVVRSLSRVLIFNPGRHIEYNLRKDLFAHLLRLQPSFYATQKRGDIVSRAANDISWVRTLVGFGGLQVINVTLAVALTGWKMMSLSPRLTFVVLVPIALGAGLVQWGIRRLFLLARRSQEQLGEISEHVLGSLQGMAAIQGFVAEESFIERFETRNIAWLSTGMRLALIRSIALPLLVLSGGVAMFALIAVGGRMALSGTLTVGELAAFTALLTVFLPPLRSMGWMMSVIQRGRAALERIFELMDAPIERPEGSTGVILDAGRGPRIDIRDLHFAYPDEPGREVLSGLTATIPAGGVVGLFGRTGSGKSTLLHLLIRLYNPPADSVYVDDVDILTLDLESWRQRLTVVPQRPFLFSDAISANVSLEEKPNVSRIRDAVDMAALGADLEALPDGLQTVVGERGIMLSGGQRQRVALARGLYRSGDVLILDDVLSAVDHQTESQLVDTVAHLARRPEAPTVLISSHRLSALRHCDTVLVLDSGRLVDEGPHSELIRRPGVYRDTWLVQSQSAADEVAS
jgi:ATP-binding cassette subfamily B multidrug efflux pump